MPIHDWTRVSSGLFHQPTFALLIALSSLAVVAQEQPEPLLRAAAQAHRQGRDDEALKLADQHIAASPKDAQGYLLRGIIRDTVATRADAIADFDKAIELDRKLAAAYQHRGVAHFMLGQAKESIADFDKFLELNPDEKPQHWQRGIALYYAGRYEDGARQFELHRTVNPDDVENAAWHFLCVARWKNPAAARAILIPIEGDVRIPMMKVHDLFAGMATADDVINEAKKGNPKPAQLNRQLFYAHLYVGLYFEAVGKTAEAKEHLIEAEKHEVPDYMYGVARMHVKTLK